MILVTGFTIRHNLEPRHLVTAPVDPGRQSSRFNSDSSIHRNVYELKTCPQIESDKRCCLGLRGKLWQRNRPGARIIPTSGPSGLHMGCMSIAATARITY